jgi:PTS system mannose-specific IID component
MSAARVPVPTLVRVYLRSFFLQAGWNPEGMQNLGFCYAITPALDALYPDEPRRRRALERHLEFFNCHPYLAAAILGATIFQETRVASGELPPEAPSQMKRALGPPFAALGDGFFWLALRPAAALVAALTVPALGLGSIFVFLGLYNTVHLIARVALFAGGVQRGPNVIGLVKQLQMAAGTNLLKAAAAVMAGALAGHAVLAAALPWRPLHALLVGSVIVVATFLLPKARPLFVLYLALLLGLVAGGGFF